MSLRRPLFTLPLPLDLVASLMKAGYRTCEDLLPRSNTEPCQEVLSILEANSMSWETFTHLSLVSKSSALSILKDEEAVETIPSFSEALDDILGGGIHLGSLLQVCGPPGSGKTQLLMQLCLSCGLPESLGGLNAGAVYIDSDRAFTIHRLSEMAAGAAEHCERVCTAHRLVGDLSVDKLLRGVKYLEVTSHIHLLASLHGLNAYLHLNKAKLVVIDSLAPLLLTLSNSLDRTRCLARIMKELRLLATRHSIAIVVVNHLTTWISPNGDKTLVPSFGESASHLFNTVLLLSRQDGYFTGAIHKSSYLQPKMANFVVLKEGVRDMITTSLTSGK